MTNKEVYHELCITHKEIPLFLQDWWMNCVSIGNSWDVIILYNEKAEVIGFLPYMLIKKAWLKIILQPLLSQTNGLWIDSSKVSINNLQECTYSIHSQLISKINQIKPDWFLQYFHHSVLDLSVFQKEGYSISQRNTYIIEDISNPDALIKTFSPAKQRHIRKAQRAGLKVSTEMSPADFVRFHSQVLEAKGTKNLNKLDVETALCNEAILRKQGAILRVYDDQQQTHAALFLVWDQTTAYYLIPATLPQYKSSGASTLIVWEAIRMAQKVGCIKFDFEGSMEKNIANSYKQYGTVEYHYPQVEKINNPLIRLIKRIKKG